MLRADLVAAFMLLTRLPVGRFARVDGPPNLGRCVWAFPLVGLVVNGLGGLAYSLAHWARMSPPLAAIWTIGVMVFLTGGLHEDGLADTADGFGGGATPSRKMEIMRDSRIGSYGALALLLSVLIRTAAIAALGTPQAVMTGLLVAGMLGRSGMILPVLMLTPAREAGMGATLGTRRLRSALAGLAIAILTSFLSLRALSATLAVLFGFGAALCLTKLVQSQIDGYTGDTIGAIEVSTECVVLSVFGCLGAA